MATTADFRRGMTIVLEGELYQLVEFLHVKPGKGHAFVRTKLKNVRTGAVIERTFRAGEEIEEVRLERKPMQYLYQADNLYYFMDLGTYEQLPLSGDLVGDTVLFLKEGMEAEVLVSGDTPIGVEPPLFVELEVRDTEPGVRGDTVSGGSKRAVLETGAVVQVPLFINVGDRVKVDTRTGKYVERVS